jgi:outer membrane receptor protein involved in Fe transport
MKQRATRAPNVAELYSPLTTGLDNAKQDPCSVANKDKIDAKLKQLCVSTGVLPGQVGFIQDIVSGQINVIEGSDPANPPEEETANTTTVGMVWTPDLGGRINDFSVAIDYYNIDIQGYIDEYSAQQTLDQCYKAGRADVCALIRRVDGDLTSPSWRCG